MLAVTSDCDAAMLVNTADGQWHFDDDANGNLDPRLTIPAGAALDGQVDVWIGTFAGGECAATLNIAQAGAAMPPSAPGFGADGRRDPARCRGTRRRCRCRRAPHRRGATCRPSRWGAIRRCRSPWCRSSPRRCPSRHLSPCPHPCRPRCRCRRRCPPRCPLRFPRLPRSRRRSVRTPTSSAPR